MQSLGTLPPKYIVEKSSAPTKAVPASGAIPVNHALNSVIESLRALPPEDGGSSGGGVIITGPVQPPSTVPLPPVNPDLPQNPSSPPSGTPKPSSPGLPKEGGYSTASVIVGPSLSFSKATYGPGENVDFTYINDSSLPASTPVIVQFSTTQDFKTSIGFNCSGDAGSVPASTFGVAGVWYARAVYAQVKQPGSVGPPGSSPVGPTASFSIGGTTAVNYVYVAAIAAIIIFLWANA